MDEAIAEFREAIRLAPSQAVAHINLGALFCEVNGDYEAGISEYREAIRLQPDEVIGHVNLGIARKGQGKFNDAIAACREAIRIQADCAPAHAVLGSVFWALGQLDEAVAECREAIRLQASLIEAHINLGLAVRAQGKLAEALTILQGAVELAQPGSPTARDVSCLIRRIERQRALRPRLSGVLKGDDRPADGDEMVTFAELCRDKRLHTAAVRLWAEALSSDAKLADDRIEQHRYNAAQAAVMAGSGRTEDDPAPDENERAELRQQALDWLTAERATWAALLESNPAQAAPAIVRVLQDWRTDRDLASVRDADVLAKLPTGEQESWRRLWADVEELLKKARGIRR